MASGGGSGSDSNSYADTATLPLMQRNSRSTTALFNSAATAAGDTLGVPATGLIILRWFSMTTAPCSWMKDGGSSAAISLRSCSFAVVLCSSTHGTSVTTQNSSTFGSKYGL